MTHTLNFLQGNTPLTKAYKIQPDGSILKHSYPNIYEVTSIEEICNSLKDLCVVMKKHATAGHCMLKGALIRKLVKESRAGTTDPNGHTSWILFDLDGVNFKSPDEFMKTLGFSNVSYIVQYSASHHIFDNTLRCHILVFLDTPCAAAILKQHLIAWNFSVPSLKSMLTLTRTEMALRYGLDITTCQNDKLIYIAPPILDGVADPLKGKQRIEYVKKSTETLTLPPTPSITLNKAEIEAHIATLRAAKGLTPRKNTYKVMHGVEIMSKPDQAIISAIKEERGFVYFNLNGGDSWAYYHPINNPDVILNFKGEPNYQTKELLPEYWGQVTQSLKASAPIPTPPKPNAQGVMHLAFLDRASCVYWRGTYIPATDELSIGRVNNENQVRQYAIANNITVGDSVPEWDMSFDPMDKVRVDPHNKTVNLFQPTVYMQAKPKATPIKAIPPICYKIIFNAVGSDKACFDQFINWLAYIAQNLNMTRTAWILQGTEGTGKGVLFEQILKKLFGEHQTKIRTMSTLDSIHNDYLEQSFITVIDEVQTSTLANEKGIMAKLRNFVTEPTVAIRKMRTNEYQIKNYNNFLFYSNQPDPVAIPKTDRRFNVGKYQNEKLIVTNDEIDVQLPKELFAFYQYLSEYQVDITAVRTPLNNEARNTMMEISETTIDQVSNALIKGSFTYFMELLPDSHIQESLDRDVVENYKAVLTRVIDRTTDNGKCNISRDELRVLYQYTVGGMPIERGKFARRLTYHRIHLKPVWIDGKTPQGVNVVWLNPEKLAQHRAVLVGKPTLKLVSKEKKVKK